MKTVCVSLVCQDLKTLFMFSRKTIFLPLQLLSPTDTRKNSNKNKTKTKVLYLINTLNQFHGNITAYNTIITRLLIILFHDTYTWSCINNDCDTWPKCDVTGVNCVQQNTPGLTVFFIDQIEQVPIFFVFFFSKRYACAVFLHHVPLTIYRGLV